MLCNSQFGQQISEIKSSLYLWIMQIIYIILLYINNIHRSSSASSALVWQILQEKIIMCMSFIFRTYIQMQHNTTHAHLMVSSRELYFSEKKCINIFFFSLLLFFRKNKFSFIETIHAIFNIIFTNYEWIYELWIRCLQLDTNKFSLEIRSTRPKTTYINIYAHLKQHIFLIKLHFYWFFPKFS